MAETTLSYAKIFHDFDEQTAKLNDHEKGALLLAVVRYSASKQEPCLEGNEQFLFPVFKAQIDRDQEAYAAKTEKNRENGKLGGRPKKNPENRTVIFKTEKSQDKDKDKDKENNIYPSNEGKEKPQTDEGFTKFWAAYPRKEGKKTALKAFRKIAPDADLLTKMLEAIERQKKSKQWKDGFTPHASTWLNGERWNDEMPTTAERKPVHVRNDF